MEGVAAVIMALSTLVTACVAAYSVWHNGRNIKEGVTIARSVDLAVNTKPPGKKTISQQVEDLASRLPAQDEAAQKVIDKEDTPK